MYEPLTVVTHMYYLAGKKRPLKPDCIDNLPVVTHMKPDCIDHLAVVTRMNWKNHML